MNGKQAHSLSDTSVTSPDPSPTDPWLFTDPFARDFYIQRNLVDRLEEDIQTYVMFEGSWAREELECKLEIRRLLRRGHIAPMGSFGYLSPHPTVYRTLKVGTFIVSKQKHTFQVGEDLIFEPWLARYSDPGRNGPLRIGPLYHVSNPLLCCESFPHVCIHCGNTLVVMRQILNYRNNE